MTLTLYPLLASAVLEGAQYLRSYQKNPRSRLGENAAVKNLTSLRRMFRADLATVCMNLLREKTGVAKGLCDIEEKVIARTKE